VKRTSVFSQFLPLCPALNGLALGRSKTPSDEALSQTPHILDEPDLGRRSLTRCCCCIIVIPHYLGVPSVRVSFAIFLSFFSIFSFFLLSPPAPRTRAQSGRFAKGPRWAARRTFSPLVTPFIFVQIIDLVVSEEIRQAKTSSATGFFAKILLQHRPMVACVFLEEFFPA
jgi:hypothetical protein